MTTNYNLNLTKIANKKRKASIEMKIFYFFFILNFICLIEKIHTKYELFDEEDLLTYLNNNKYGFRRYVTIDDFIRNSKVKQDCYNIKRKKFNFKECRNQSKLKSYLMEADILRRNFIDAFMFINCQNEDFRKEGFPVACPDPCLKKPCYTMNYVASYNCTTNKDAIYDDDFMCECSKFAYWSKELKKCLLENPCLNGLGCGGEKRSELCIFNKRKLHLKCKCKPEWMGENCSLERDACKENYFKSKKSGSKSCGDNGRCDPVLGTNFYKCNCNMGYKDDPSSLEADCSLKIDPCDKTICVNGFCEHQEAQEKEIAKCICDAGWTGEHCEKMNIVWLPWERWSSCTPECGLVRFRFRTRSCNGELKKCLSNQTHMEDSAPTNIEKQECAYIPCPNESFSISNSNNFEWNLWSKCDAECGYGIQYSYKQCTHNDFYLGCYDLQNNRNIMSRSCYSKPCMNLLLLLDPVFLQETITLTIILLFLSFSISLIYFSFLKIKQFLQ
jgi:hypothetical protein